MANKNGYTAEQIIKAIKGSGGIKSTIAVNLGGASYHTVQKYIDKYPTVKEAFEAEREKNLDRAEGVIMGNIALGAKTLSDPNNKQPVDSGDAKWLLSRLGKHRGYADKSEIEHSGDVNIVLTWGDNDQSNG